MKYKTSFLILATFYLILTTSVSARTTPEDIVNAKKDAYNQRVTSYSPESKQKLEDYSQKIADLNKKITEDYQLNMEAQAQILQEYIKRNPEKASSSQVENANYWLTYAHEAVAFQAAKIYIFDLSGE